MSRPSLFDDDKDSRLNQPIEKDTKYNQRMKEEQLKEQVQKRAEQINKLRFSVPKEGFLHYVALMDYVEKLMHACGAEPKANFIEVNSTLMQLATRVPMKANLYPFMPDDMVGNPRFHKAVTQALLEVTNIEGVRWIPTAEGAVLVLSIRRITP